MSAWNSVFPLNFFLTWILFCKICFTRLKEGYIGFWDWWGLGVNFSFKPWTVCINIPLKKFSYIILLSINDLLNTLPWKWTINRSIVFWLLHPYDVLARFVKSRHLVNKMTSFNLQHRTSQSSVRKVNMTEVLHK